MVRVHEAAGSNPATPTTQKALVFGQGLFSTLPLIINLDHIQVCCGVICHSAQIFSYFLIFLTFYGSIETETGRDV